jgi:hypothetical protein
MKGYAHLALVLVLLQAGVTILAALGEVVMMGGNPWYLPVPLLHTVVLVVAGANIRRPWAAITLMALEGLSLLGFWLSVVIGVLPWVDYPVNPVGLLTDFALPAAVLYLALWSLVYRHSTRTTATAVLR